MRRSEAAAALKSRIPRFFSAASARNRFHPAHRNNTPIRTRGAAQAVDLISLRRRWHETDCHKDVREIDVLEDKRSDGPLRAAQRQDIKDFVTRGLSRAERLIIILYYFEEMTMEEIGLTLDLSESRVSQMHSAILSRLRHQLDKRHKELLAVGS